MFTKENGLYVAHGINGPVSICGKMANRHGLIAGATGTGKTVSLQVLAESFSQAGVPCFMADMKGDLSGISQTGHMTDFIQKRCNEFGIQDPQFAGCPVTFWDVYGEQGHPMRTTISEMGPQLLARLMNLNDTQTGVLEIVFKVADDKGWLLIDVKDLKSMLAYTTKHASEISREYGNVTAASIGAVQRQLLALETQGADKFFAEPACDIHDMIRQQYGMGVMNVLAADKLMQNPKLYSTFLLWLLSEIYEALPEVGDMELPKLVFFFDEAHTLFQDTSPALVSKIEQVVRLVRSKGVGVYFVTQNPSDLPDSVLGQLGNRIQHALRAFTPKDQKAVRAAAETFRENPEFKTAEAIMELATGEALVSFLDEKGAPSIVERAKILFPLSQIGAITPMQRQQIMLSSSLSGKYDKIVDRESAFEILLAETEKEQQTQAQAKEEKASKGKKKEKSFWGGILAAVGGAVLTSVTRSAGNTVAKKVFGNRASSTGASIAKQATSTAVRSLTRGILGNLLK